MKTQQKPIMTLKNYGITLLIIGLAGCAHQTPFNSSAGHVGSEQDNQQKISPAGDIPKPVKKLAYVPPPKPKVKEPTYSVVVSDVPVQEILFALARESKLNVDIHPAIQGKATLNAVDQTMPAILDRLSKQIDLRYKIEGNVISITPDSPVLKTYKVDYVNIFKKFEGNLGVGKGISSGGTTSSDGSDSSSKIESNATSDFWEFITHDINSILATYRSQQAGEQELKALIEKASIETTKALLEQVTNKDKDQKDGSAAKDAQKTKDDVDKLKKELATAKNEIIVNKLAGTFTALATERQHAFIQQYLDTVMASVQRQVLIEATIVEVTLNDRFQQGIDWSRLSRNGDPNNGFTFKQTLGGAAAASGNQFVVGYTNATILGNLAASIRLLETFGDTRVLSSPKIMALNNQAALLKVVDNIVYFKVSVEPGSVSNGVVTAPVFTTSVEKAPVGVVLSVTPQISANGNVSLNVRPTISRILRFVNDPNPALAIAGVTNPVPEVQVREMESLLQVNSGQTVVLGGLMQDNLTNSSDSVPGLSNIPVLGKAFKGKDETRRKTELVIYLRPTVITDPSLESRELNSFKQYLPENQFPVAADEPVN